MTVKLLTEQQLEFLSFKGGCTGSSESTLVHGKNATLLEIRCRGSSDLFNEAHQLANTVISKKKLARVLFSRNFASREILHIRSYLTLSRK